MPYSLAKIKDPGKTWVFYLGRSGSTRFERRPSCDMKIGGRERWRKHFDLSDNFAI